jgi:hypothetical protein
MIFLVGWQCLITVSELPLRSYQCSVTAQLFVGFDALARYKHAVAQSELPHLMLVSSALGKEAQSSRGAGIPDMGTPGDDSCREGCALKPS